MVLNPSVASLDTPLCRPFLLSNGKLCVSYFKIERETLAVPSDLVEPVVHVLELISIYTWLSLDGGIHSS